MSAKATSAPICVDLEGALIRTDLLAESYLAIVRREPWMAVRMPFWLLSGMTRFKQKIAAAGRLDPAALPYRDELVTWLRAEKREGRTLILAASDETLARAVAEHLRLFDGVVAAPVRSDSAYAPAPSFASERRPFRAFVHAIRVHQWSKNLLIFLPLLTSHTIFQSQTFLHGVLAFIAVSLCASGVYIVNDLTDLESDRQHPVKRRRPFAAGALSPLTGMALAPLLILLAFAVVWPLPVFAKAVLATYLVLTTLYTFSLKRRMLLDVFTLGGLYTMRVIMGHVSARVPFSPWLLSFSMFIFLSLAACKRVAELQRLRQSGGDAAPGREYRAADAQSLSIFGWASGFASSLVLTLYMNSEAVQGLYRHPGLLWLLFPLVLYWIARIWMLTDRGVMNEDPILFAAKDRVTYVVAGVACLIMLFATRSWSWLNWQL